MILKMIALLYACVATMFFMCAPVLGVHVSKTSKVVRVLTCAVLAITWPIWVVLAFARVRVKFVRWKKGRAK